MELSGHPSQDLIDELIDRGAVPVDGDRAGPTADGLAKLPAVRGGWLFVPDEVWDTGVDDQV